MDIINTNFHRSLREVESAIDKSIFVTIDAEFSGIQKKEFLCPFDFPEERYHVLRKGDMGYGVVQFGLCAFFYDAEKKAFTHCPFNYYIYPRQLCQGGPDYPFMSLPSSMQFLIKHGLDTNKLITNGIPYLTQTDEDHLRKKLERNFNEQMQNINNPHEPKKVILVPDEESIFVEGVCRKIEEFLYGSEDSMSLEPCSSFRRKLIYQEAGRRFLNIFLVSMYTVTETHLVVWRINTDDDKKRILQAHYEHQLSKVEENAGFSRVIQKLSASKKLIVGHNMVLDVLHMIHHFLGPLPKSYEEFKTLVASAFPNLLDTKLMVTNSPFRYKAANVALKPLVGELRKKPYSITDVASVMGKVGYTLSLGSDHVAGYDAYITGLCFISLTDHLGTLQSPPQARVFPGSPLLEPYLNKMYLMNTQYPHYMDLGTPDINPNREHMFYVRSEMACKKWELQKLFEQFGPITIHKVSDNQAYVTLTKPELSGKVMPHVKKHTSYSVIPFDEHQIHTMEKE